MGAVEKLDFEMSKALQEPLDLISYIDAAQVMITDLYDLLNVWHYWDNKSLQDLAILQSQK